MSGHIRIATTPEAAALQEEKTRWLTANRIVDLRYTQNAIERWLESKPADYAADMRGRIAQVQARRQARGAQ